MKQFIFFLFFAFHFFETIAQETKLVIPTGHSNRIQSIDISRDGKLIATGSLDNSVIIWDSKTWKQLRTISLNNPVQRVIFSGDAKFLITVDGSDEKGLTSVLNFFVWNVNTGNLITPLPFSGSSECVLSPDGNMLAVPFFTETTSNGGVTEVALAFQKEMMAVWDLNKNKKIETSLGFSNIAEIINHKNSYYLLTAGQNLSGIGYPINLWDVRNAGQKATNTSKGDIPSQPLKSFNNKNKIELLAASPAGTLFATNVPKGIVRLWSVESESPVREYKATGNYIKNISFSGDGKNLFVYSNTENQYYFNSWNLSDSTIVSSCRLPDRVARHKIRFAPKGNYLIIENGNSADVHDIHGNLIVKLSGHSIPFDNYVFSTNNRFVNTGQKINLPKTQADYAALSEMLTGSMVEIMETKRGAKFTKAERDSVIKVLDKARNINKKVAPSSPKFRVWDLQYGIASSATNDTIQFTSDSISPDKRYKLTTNYKSTSLRNFGTIILGMSGDTKDEKYDFIPGDNTKKILDTSGIFYKMVKDKVSTFNKEKTSSIILINNRTKDTVYLFALDSTDWMIMAPDGYYMSSKNSAGILYYTVNNKVISFEQLDLKNNRPDKILEKIGFADKSLIEAYRNAYQKRLERLNIDTAYFRDSYTVPEADILNKEDIGYVQKNQMLKLNIRCIESKNKLERFNVWINQVPIFGMKGINVSSRNKNNFDTSVALTLSQGDNRIETSVINSAGIESYRSPLFIKYSPLQTKEENVYFIGIGINRFADNSYNLQYCEKDIQDLANKLKEKYGSRLKTEVLLNENVTTENVKALKQKLLQCKEDDKVIIIYSGHGLLSKNYDYYLSTYNVSFSQPAQNGLPYEELENLVDGIRARKKLMLIDACHSGEVDKTEMQKMAVVQADLAKKGDVRGIKLPASQNNKLGIKNSFELMQELFANVSRGTGTTIISAAAGTQFALERGDLKNGVFTYSLLETMNKYPTIKISELKKIVGERVEQLTNGLQKPTSRNETIAVDWSLW